MRLKETIDATKFDIRVLCTGSAESADAGYVEGVPIDAPDENEGWKLVDLWVEHDTVQEKGEKGTVVTRKTNPAYYQLWAREKTKAKVKGKRGRPKKTGTSISTTVEVKPGTDIGKALAAAGVTTAKPSKPARSTTPTERKPRAPKKAKTAEVESETETPEVGETSADTN